jgi:putative endonuclease
MLNKRQRFGKIAEAMAARQLEKRGYKILARNHRTRLGEIDLIAMDGQTLVFIEVKARRSGRFGSAKHAVTPAKQKKISRVALSYLKETNQTDASARFDVVALDAGQDTGHLEIIKNAFDLNLQ